MQKMCIENKFLKFTMPFHNVQSVLQWIIWLLGKIKQSAVQNNSAGEPLG